MSGRPSTGQSWIVMDDPPGVFCNARGTLIIGFKK
jgi:hypothetical protein